MFPEAVPCYVTALEAMGLAVAVAVRDAWSVSHLSFAAGMATLAIESLLIGQSAACRHYRMASRNQSGESGSKLHALHTLREIRLRLCRAAVQLV